jgi:hypothetical protein
MQYLLLIYGVEANWGKMTAQEQATMNQEFGKLTQELQELGKFRAGSQLAPTKSATTVRVRNGKRLATDGPFAETKEQLGGYYLVEANDLDDAIAIAGQIPLARSGSIEVRPLVAAGARTEGAKG